MKKKIIIWTVSIIAFLIIGIFAFIPSKVDSFQAVENFDGEIKIYKSTSCGCCDVYINYFKGRGNSKAQAINQQELDGLKRQYEIPENMKSCHTTIIGDYFVEGHIPLEAIEKLLQEKPDIKGIALPGMPMGSPGMVGAKIEKFVIYAINNDGSNKEFMRI
ncbi:hypothetical protein J4443_03160 [Candidatus Woesearchaeota archaeon]|nr:hypothetical protein [Candidatus Woesearchaeota archaeon]